MVHGSWYIDTSYYTSVIRYPLRPTSHFIQNPDLQLLLVINDDKPTPIETFPPKPKAHMCMHANETDRCEQNILE